ncbi:DUF5684 domain-containing protein [Clostridium sp. HBUAS56010]|uniref:DUF5684 domain-containing protein n=1 Tax=Clostridium sp. HBUAS56010 TaxID=2571127 RepID=UPI0011773D5E|nr:DUF5684 domain-containing protein [Clostridium sp. HBUAS56010]
MKSLYEIIVMLALCVLVLLVVITVSKWMIFVKARENGWAAIIPFYGDYVLSQVVFGSNIYFKLLMVSIAFRLFNRMTGFAVLGIIAALIQLFMHIKCSINLAYSFGKGKSFIVGLIFLPIIFYPILAFGNSKYISPNLRYII